MSLQQQFIDSKGEPVKFEGEDLIQMDCIPLKKGKISINFKGGNSQILCGIAIKSAKGSILLSDGNKAKTIYIWDEYSLPKTVDYEVYCPDGKLKIWNIYRIEHKSGLITEDYWTNNAGIKINKTTENSREYSCSHGLGEIDLDNFIFEIKWKKAL